ncbi:MAG: hypothetical protein C0483_24245 [Pirellula sp.]|nr:hypothetical protein [Pirellula sp.]
MIRFNQRTPLLSQLRRHGLEFDQKLMRAVEVSASCPDLKPEDRGFPDSYLTLALYRLNTTLTRLIDLDESRLNLFHEYSSAPKCEPAEVKPSARLCSILDVATALATPGKTIGVGHYLRAIINVTRTNGEEPAIGFTDQVLHSTFSIETLMWGLGYHAWTPLAKAPKVQELFAAIEGQETAEDIPYLLTTEGNRIVFRAMSILDPYLLAGANGEARPNLAVLSHFREQYGSVTPSELMELEDLINHPRAKELDLQLFFEKHPQFFRRWDKRDVFPHIYLRREDDGPLVPDFLLIDPEAQRATILDLKLPSEKLIRRQKNRDRFSAAVLEAQAQLREYRDWFEVRSNREQLKARLGIEIYRPQLGVIIGSSSEFRDAFDRQKLSDSLQGIDIVTYDDIVASAQQRLSIIRSART